MAIAPVDILILIGIFALLVAPVFVSRSHVRSVADFLSAGRSAGRYLIAISSGAAGLGAITIVANFEMNLVAGFSMSWWGMTMGIFVLFVTVSGWVIYRFRQTRCMTLAQYFEMRYSRRFRIFTGIIAFLAGIVNMGIFPAVEARFFLYFTGLPHTYQLLGMTISTYATIMVILLSISLWFIFNGGQVAVIITDFFQGAFMNLAMLAIVLFFVFRIDWSAIEAALQTAPANASLINPFHTSQVKDFNFWYFMIGIVGLMYGAMSWQGTQAYNSSAENAHEAKMAGVIGLWRGMPQSIMLAFVPIAAFTILHHDAFAPVAKFVGAIVATESTEVGNQIKVPLVIQQMLPHGLLGVFLAVAFCASITTFNSYLHSWGTILIQDVALPLRGRPLDTKQHLHYLRMAILFVAIFIFIFSLLYKQTQFIMLFFAITGAIFAGGSGAVIIGGLYWKRGTSQAAWIAMITGSFIAVSGLIVHEFTKVDFGPLNLLRNINGQENWALAMFSSAILYVVVSLVWKPRVFDIDKLLHRGQYAVEGDQHVVTTEKRGWKILGMGSEFTRGDRIIYILNYVWTFGWFVVFIVGTVYNLTHEVSDDAWMRFWKVQLIINVVLAVVTTVWYTIGGMFDLKRMFKNLHTRVRDDSDDGFVR